MPDDTFSAARGRLAPKRIAVVGSGISGLASAWLLSQRHRVTLFESEPRLGGHTCTVDVAVDGQRFPVDVGFLVFNDRTYPNLCALFRELGIQSAASEMTFSVRIEDRGLEWSGTSLSALFVQKRNLVKAEFWGMLADILRFNREAMRAMAAGAPLAGSLGEFLERGRYGRAFRDWYLLPMSAAIWSCPTGTMLGYPAATFLRFCYNHGLLELAGRPKWRTVLGGGREYVRQLAAAVADVRLGTRVVAVERRDTGVEVQSTGRPECFDEVVLATHADVSRRLLRDPSPAEARVLGAFSYQPNQAVLHTDARFLPRRAQAWSAWNYRAEGAHADHRPVSVSYLLNRLQPLPVATPVIVTLNPEFAPDPARVLGRFTFSHPVFDASAAGAQRLLPSIQGKRNTWYCGAWTGYGFHEDGLSSALRVGRALGADVPWQVAETAAA